MGTNLGQNNLKIVQHLFISVPQHTHPSFLNLPMPDAIRPPRPSGIMNRAIQFQSQMRLSAVKISDVIGPQRMLATELRAVQSAAAQTLP
jgi:hypothetical protein